MPESSVDTLKQRLAQPAVAASLFAIVLGLAAYLLGWHRFVPILGRWEHFQFYYNYGAADPFLSFAIAPRANLAGKGYPLLDFGVFFTDLFGLTLTKFRAVTLAYALATSALLMVVFSRWFGRPAAIAGVTVTVLSTGYLVFANQLLVLLPTLMLCVLLVERCQRLADEPGSHLLIAAIGLISALLIIHYAMGRFFAVGWLGYFFGFRLLNACRNLAPGENWREPFRTELKTGAKIALVAVVALCILSYRNAYFLLDPWNVFFPRVGTEVEMDPGDLWNTITVNLRHIGEIVFPFIRIPGEGLPEAIISAYRAPILNLWHGPFLVLGFLVAVQRAAVRPLSDGAPYLGLHVLLFLTVGLTVFSEHFNGRSTISVYRLFGGYFAFAGYIAVAFLWLHQTAARLTPALRNAPGILLILVVVWAVISLDDQRRHLESRLADLAEIDPETEQFVPRPEKLPYGTKPTTYLQARYKKLADLLAQGLRCRSREDGGGNVKPLILRVAPAVLVSRGKYDGIFYMEPHNDLSATLAFYLADRGLNTGHLVIHREGDPGYRSRGDGYGGEPRVFSGPISWSNGEIVYKAKRPWRTTMKWSNPIQAPRIIVTFSSDEADEAARKLQQTGRKVMVSGRVESVLALTQENRAQAILCPGRT